MYNVVHGTKLQVCQWTGEALKTEDRFKIPSSRKRAGIREWIGCYSSPGAAVSAIKAYGERDGCNADAIAELFDEFETSLRRKIGMENVKITINPAPDFKILKSFGGTMDIAAFHKSYGHDEQIQVYYQEIPAKGMTEVKSEATPPIQMEPLKFDDMEYDSDPGRLPNAPKRWRRTKVRIGFREEEERETVPRGLAGVVEWMRDISRKNFGEDKNAVIYFHPTLDTEFAIGTAKAWIGDVTMNRIASDLLGKNVVAGQACIYSKNKLRGESIKRRKEDSTEEPELKSQKI